MVALRVKQWILLSGISSLLMMSCGLPRQLGHPAGNPALCRHKVIVLIVDSLTSDALTKAASDAKYPAIRYLMEHGHYFPKVIASFPSMTVSDVSTLLTGTYPEAHRIPGLVWIDVHQQKVINYGNNFRQALMLGPHSVVQNALYALNQTHLSKHVRTVFEDLQTAGHTTGAINLLVFRGKTPHQISLPLYARPFFNPLSYRVLAANTFVFGQLTANSVGQRNQGIFHRMGLNDDFSTQSLIQLIKSRKLPDFTMVYLPDNDSVIHKQGVYAMRGVEHFDKNLQKILSTYGNWAAALTHATLVIMGDSGVTPVLPAHERPTILLRNLFPHQAIYRWGHPIRAQDDVGFAVNSRMAYVYLFNHRISLEQAANRLRNDRRIDVVAWSDGRHVRVTNQETRGSVLQFRKGGPYKDPYGVAWTIQGSPKVLDIRIDSKGAMVYGRYPDALHQLWSALHDQDGHYLVVTAKRGYQFGDERSPTHDGGAQQASLLDEDVYAPLLIDGTDRLPSKPLRFVDLKRYFLSLVQNYTHME